MDTRNSGLETPPPRDKWESGAIYETYVGRWSRPVAREFLNWLAVPPGSRWLDVGCGTGALSETILRQAEPASVTGVDLSPAHVSHAREHVTDSRARFDVGDAQRLPVQDQQFDAVVSGLVLNFIPDPSAALREMARAASTGGVVAIYVWDYAGEMQMMRHFWDAAVALNVDALPLDEGRRFPICQPDALAALFTSVGLDQVTTRGIDIATHFRDFDDYWTPFLGGQGPAPGYVQSLDEPKRAALRDRIRQRLPVNTDGSIDLIARAWAARGTRRPA